MERLTNPEIDYSAVGVVDEMRTATIAGMLCRLAAYEEIGPLDEVRRTLRKLRWYEALFDQRPYVRWREIAKAEDEGRLVVFPCNAGETVYVPDYDAVRELHVEEISTTETRSFIGCTFSCSGWGCPCVFEHFAYTGEEYDCNNYGYIEIPVEEFGKTWFLSREDAEKALEVHSEHIKEDT